ncbi:uncharacterized protein DDB_G0283697-like [Telopea speciosissima]|uniref:uncharacterized protein DDB_G0283697-like n=1 Tax=Telopea speciosissima TaxID=54955 RepID=UPI001CC33D03|nr:uncharacterized protein DDB_G0283697-like [Telopea speciosissima]
MAEHGNPVLPQPLDPLAAMLEMFQKFTADQKTLVEDFRAEQRAIAERLQVIEHRQLALNGDSNVPIEEDRYQLHSVVQRLPDRDGSPRDDYRGYRDGHIGHRDRFRADRDDRDGRDYYRDRRDRARDAREPSKEHRDHHRGYKDRDREDREKDRGRQPTFEEYMRSYFTGDQGTNRRYTDNQKVKLELKEFDGHPDPQVFYDWLAAIEDYFD